MENFKYIVIPRLRSGRENPFSRLPKTPGVYAFKSKNALLYIGKAINIQERVKNHFRQPVFRDNLFIEETSKIGYFETGSEIEALLLEAKLIKKYQPKFNVMWRDDKNYFYVAIAKNDQKIPYIYITHQPKLKIENCKLKIDYVGPFTEGTALKKTLRLLRRIFPYYTAKHHKEKLCLWCHLKMCPGPNPDLKKYRKDLKNLIAFLQGKKITVLRNLKKEMAVESKNQNYEKAGEARDKINAMEIILHNARVISPESHDEESWKNTEKLLKKIAKAKDSIKRIEGYDISNIQGKNATGSMVVFVNGKSDKNEYRKFKIKFGENPNDIAMLKEVLTRRFSHKEWPMPDLILIDGGKAQLNIAIKSKISPYGGSPEGRQNIKAMAIAKKHNDLYIEGKNKPIPLNSLPREIFNLILQIRDESHRFARAYHHKLRAEGFTLSEVEGLT